VPLMVGERVLYEGEVWIVEMVNECRARLRPERKRQVRYTVGDGSVVEFEGTGRPVSVSPNADLERAT
jgi:hypothetical protein